MNGFKGQHDGLRATLYLELVPREMYEEAKVNPFFTSESNILGLTEKLTVEGIAATRYRTMEEQREERKKEREKKNLEKSKKPGAVCCRQNDNSTIFIF